MPQTIAIAHQMIAFTNGKKEDTIGDAIDGYVVRMSAPVNPSIGIDEGPALAMTRRLIACHSVPIWQFTK